MSALLQLKNVKYTYGPANIAVLNDVNAEFEAGTMYNIMGASGAGKSTMLSLLAGLDTPYSGEVLFNGENIAKTGYVEHRKKHISLVFQNFNLIDYLTPLENLRLVNSHADVQVLIDLGLTEEEANRNVTKLSGGQQQRVAIGRALVSSAPVILADEPTGSLDPATTKEVIAILKNAAREHGKCVIVVTHDSKVASQADVKYVLKNKQLTRQSA